MPEITNHPPDYVAIAVPIFLLLIGAEAIALRKRAELRYRMTETFANLSCGILQLLSDLFLKSVFVAAYFYVYRQGSLLTWPSNTVVCWFLSLICMDFTYYAWHRASHRINFLWASHVVHHQSPAYNLSVALRQSALGQVTSWIFYLPLALLGLPPTLFLVHSAISLIYQFWIHTQAIPKLGWFEILFNTPSHHRVHHAINPRYIDKNYAAIFILWDKWFGTFEEEAEPAIYGTVEPFESFNPVWANLAYWVKLLRLSKHSIQVFFMPPDWRPEKQQAAKPQLEKGTHAAKHWPPSLGKKESYYIAINYVIISLAVLFFIRVKPSLSLSQLVPLAIFLLVSVCAIAGLSKQSRLVAGLEPLRLIFFCCLIKYYFSVG